MKFIKLIIFLSTILSKISHSMNVHFLQARNAATDDDSKIVLKYLNQGGNIDQTDDHGMTILECAMRKNHSDLAELLLMRGANPNISNMLSRIVISKKIEMANLLLKNGADPNQKSEFNQNALQKLLYLLAATKMLEKENKIIKIIKLILKNKKNMIDLSHKDIFRNTVFDYAKAIGDQEIIKLIENPEQINDEEVV